MRFLFDKIDWKALADNKRLKLNIGLSVILIIIFLLVIDIVFSRNKFRIEPQREETPKTEQKTEKVHAPLPVVQKRQHFSGARVAIILDDAGGVSVNYGKIFSIKQHLTLAILPHMGTSSKFAKEAHEEGLEVMLHMPMEPENKNYIRKDSGMILCSQNDDDIKKTVIGDIASFSFISGINNHEGSRATSDNRVMKAVLEAIKPRGLFFIDSKTSISSIAHKTAESLRVPSAENNIFLDSTTDEAGIAGRFRQLMVMARTKGSAIGIGHATRPSTIDILKKLMPEYEKEGVRFVYASELVK